MVFLCGVIGMKVGGNEEEIVVIGRWFWIIWGLERVGSFIVF